MYVERVMFEVVSLFWDFDDHYEYEAWESDLEYFFSYFSLTIEEKYWYARLKLDGETYYWRDNYKLCQYWFILQGLPRTQYAPLICSSELDCREPNLSKSPNLRANQSLTISLQRLRQIQSLQSLSKPMFLMS